MNPVKENIVLYANQKYKYLADSLLKENTNWSRGVIDKKIFPNEEIHRIIQTSPQNKHVVLIGGTTEAEAIELFLIGRALEKYQAKSIHIVIPFFNNSTQERATVSGEIVTAKGIAALLSSIPIASQGNFIYMLDLHSENIVHYFEGFCKSIHIKSKSILYPVIQKIKASVLAAPDAGRSKTIEKMATDLNMEPALTLKRRNSDPKNPVSITTINADVKGKNIIIYDDMIRSGGTILNSAQAYKDAGAKEISVVTTHGDFCSSSYNDGGKSGIEKLLDSDLITEVHCSNSTPKTLNISHPKFHLYKIDKLISEHINKNIGDS